MGAWQMLQPRRFGGQSMPAGDFVAAVAAAAAQDGSAGWRCAMANAAAYWAAVLPDRAGTDIWGGDGGARVAIGRRPGGRLERGRLTGQWSDVTGADLADWLLLAADEDRLVLLPRAAVVTVVPTEPAGLPDAGLAELTVTELPVTDERVFPARDDGAAVITGAAAGAAVAGAADGLWRVHVAQVQEKLAASYGSAETADLTVSTRQAARAAADIDAATLQIVASLSQDPGTAARAQRQAVVRAREAADRVLGSSRGHALDASDPVARLWRDVHTGCRLALRLLDDLDR
ncbi:acyl-CoA dehydrogenase family protein [[Mycobacterium] nativiensis]|uniref:Acyl-CoA dehydrogenase C-terminal domain-containing protein n=1 Tax=[Mycobacterium] nativiensis TaxID=2855503 RepID=A0ABU5XTE5_9MYCO|nr:hypothetical protein [Mycolicibacter sp. MYC340]MEB3030281.1 hypothetical protein [Mycolicibacter sp. MYC340]